MIYVRLTYIYVRLTYIYVSNKDLHELVSTDLIVLRATYWCHGIFVIEYFNKLF